MFQFVEQTKEEDEEQEQEKRKKSRVGIRMQCD